MKQEKTIDISVIVPVYNTAPYLAECLDSILAQTIENIEIVCVDDGSTDDSLKILREYETKDSRLIILTQQNSGVAVARNTGIAASSGKYLAFVDSDDTVEPNFCERMFTIAEKEDDELVIFFPQRYFQRLIKRYPQAKRLLQRYTYKKKIDFKSPSIEDRIFLVYFTGSCWNCLFQRKFWEQNNLAYPIGINHSEDQTVCCQAFARANRITLFEAELYHYRRRENSAERSAISDSGKAIISSMITVYCKIRDFYLSSQKTAPLTAPWAAVLLRQMRNTNFSSDGRDALLKELDLVIDDDLLRAIHKSGYASFMTRLVWAPHYARTRWERRLTSAVIKIFSVGHKLIDSTRRTLRTTFLKKKWNS